MWFRRDLRLADNPALLSAVSDATDARVVPLFVLDPALWRPAGPARRAYLAASLTDLGVLQMNDDPNNLLLIWAVGDTARATAFFDSPALAAHMVKNAGVIGPPERHFWKA